MFRAAALAALALIAACSTTQAPPRPLPQPPEVPEASAATRWAARLTAIASISDWRVRGKVAYRLPEDAGSASLDWQQSGADSDLRLSGPLGVGSTEIHNEGALLRVRRDGIERLYPADAAPWLPDGSLLPVPVDSIRHWLRGVPDPDLPLAMLERDDALAKRMEQAGWEIRFEDYRDVQGMAMPARLTLEAPGAELTLKVILRDWEFE
jgi:outer membrane lipoprotein LolB